MMGTGILTAALCGGACTTNPLRHPTQKNPTELRSALVFAAVYAGCADGLVGCRETTGRTGIVRHRGAVGLTDMDAITMSTARMVRAGSQAGEFRRAKGGD